MDSIDSNNTYEDLKHIQKELDRYKNEAANAQYQLTKATEMVKLYSSFKEQLYKKWYDGLSEPAKKAEDKWREGGGF